MLVYHTRFKPLGLKSLPEASVVIILCIINLQYVFLPSWTGAICSLCWSPDSTMFAVASVTGLVQLYQGSGREYSLANEIKEIQVHVHVYTQSTCHLHVRMYTRAFM